MNVIEWIIENKYARNIWQATNIANGLQLATLHGQPEKQQERVKLYRRWRDSKVYNETKPCYEKAIEGVEPPAEMFEVGREPGDDEDDYLYMAIHNIGGGFIE